MAIYQFSFGTASLPDDTFEVVKATGVEGLSRLFEYRITAITAQVDLDVASILRDSAVLTLTNTDYSNEVRIRGIVAQCEVGALLPSNKVLFHLTLVPQVQALTLNVQCQVYQDKSIPDIVRALLTENGLQEGKDFRLALTKTDYPVLEYVVQYQESDWAFISRLLEHVGIYYYFQEGETTDILVLLDNRQTHDLATEATMFRMGVGVNPAGEAVAAIGLRQSMKPANVVLSDYNWRSPDVEMLSRAQAAGSGRGTVTEYGDHFKTPTEGDFLALVRAQEIQCGESVYHGDGMVRAFRPGLCFVLDSHYRADCQQQFLLTEVTHYIESLESIGTAEGGSADRLQYRNEFKAIPANVQFRPSRVTPKPRIYGTINAIVESSIPDSDYADIDELGRYKVRLPFDTSTNGAGKASRYIRMAQPYAGDEYGSHFPLHAGTEVLLTHIDGDPDRPIITGAVPNATTPSPVNAANASQSVVRTAGDNQIVMEDTAGGRFINLSTPEAANGSSFIQLGAGGDLWQATPPVNPGVTPPDDRIKVILSPKVLAVPAYGSYILNPTVLYATDHSVTWSLDQGAELGTITEDGLFVAPPEVDPDNNIVVARATSNENPDKYDECRIVLYAPYEEMKRLYLAPATLRMEVGETTQLVAIPVGVSQDESPVGWEVIGGAANGTVSLTGVYTPPATAPSGPVTVRAHLLVDPSNYAEATITVFPAGSRNPSVANVSVSPRNVRLGPNETAQFRATLTGDANTAVTWETDAPGSIDSSGLFTAPASFSSPSVVSVRARSVAQSSRAGESQVVLYKPPTPPITVLVDPDGATISADMTQQFTATVVGNSNTTVTWECVPASAGSIDANGLFTPSGAGSVVIRAISQADSSYVGAAQLTVLAAGALIQVEVTPASVDVTISRTQQFTATLTGTTNQAVTWSVVGGAANGTISTSGLYTAPATDPGAAVTVKAVSVANTAKQATANVNIRTTAPAATWIWDKINTEVTRLKDAHLLTEGDISIAANNSVSLTRKESISETQEDGYSSTIGNSWSYVKGNTDSLVHGNTNSQVDGNSDSTIEGHSNTTVSGGVTNKTVPYTNNITLGAVNNVTAGAASNFTFGAFLNITGGVTIEAYLGAKVTLNLGRNYKFFDVDDYEVIDKEASTAARNKVSLECGPMNPGAISVMSAQDAFANPLFRKLATKLTALAATIPPAPTCTFTLEPAAMTGIIETAAAGTGKIEFNCKGQGILTLDGAAGVTLQSGSAMNLKATGNMVLDAPSVNIAQAFSIMGKPVPPPPPPPPPPPKPPKGAAAVAAVAP